MPWQPPGSTCPSSQVHHLWHSCVFGVAGHSGSLSVYGQLATLVQMGTRGCTVKLKSPHYFMVCAEPRNKSLQMKILSWLEGNNSCWVLWHWPFKSCRSVWSRNTTRFLVRVQLRLYNGSFFCEEDFFFLLSLITCHCCLGGLCLSLEANDVQSKVPRGVM